MGRSNDGGLEIDHPRRAAGVDAGCDQLVVARQAVVRDAQLAPEDELETPDRRGPSALPSEQASIAGGDGELGVGLRVDEVERRQQQQVARHQIERHPQASRQAGARGDRRAQAAAGRAAGRVVELVRGRRIGAEAEGRVDEAVTGFAHDAVESESRAERQVQAAQRAGIRLGGDESAVDGPQVGRARQSDEATQFAPETRHRTEARPQARHRCRRQRRGEEGAVFRLKRARPAGAAESRCCGRRRKSSGPVGASEAWGNSAPPARPDATSSTCSRLARTAAAATSASSGRMWASPISTTDGCRPSR